MNNITLTKYERWLLYTALGIYIIHIAYAILTYRFLYTDGSHYFVGILENVATMRWYNARRFAHLFSQLPLVMALKIGIKNINGLLYLYGVSLFMPYVVSLAICYFAVGQDKTAYLLFPLLSIFAGSMNAEFDIISESHFLAYIFWPLFFLMLFRKGSGAFILILCLALPTLRSYQSMLFLGPILAIAAIWRGLEMKPQLRYRLPWYILTSWFVGGIFIALHAVLFPDYPQQFQSFYHSTIFFVENGSFHYPGLLSLSILLIFIIGIWKPEILSRFWLWIMIGISIACIIIVLLPILFPTKVALNLQHRARILNVYLPVMLAYSVFAIYKGWLCIQSIVWRRILFLLALLGITQGLWHLSATYQWHKYLQIFRQHVSSHCGLLPFEQSILSRLDSPSLSISREVVWGWTIPTMSIILAQDKIVRAIVETPPFTTWEPFDPTDPDQLPDLSRYGVSYEVYIHALTHPERTCQEIEALQELHEHDTL